MNKETAKSLMIFILSVGMIIIAVYVFMISPHVEEQKAMSYQQGYKRAELDYAQARALPVPTTQTITNETTNETTTINQISAFPICTDLFIQSYEQLCGGQG